MLVPKIHPASIFGFSKLVGFHLMFQLISLRFHLNLTCLGPWILILRRCLWDISEHCHRPSLNYLSLRNKLNLDEMMHTKVLPKINNCRSILLKPLKRSPDHYFSLYKLLKILSGVLRKRHGWLVIDWFRVLSPGKIYAPALTLFPCFRVDFFVRCYFCSFPYSASIA